MPGYAVFIDGGYLRAVLRSFGEPRISYAKLGDYFSHGEERLRTYFYDCAPYQGMPPTEEEQRRKQAFDRFVFVLQADVPRFQLRLGRLQRVQEPDGTWRSIQKEFDVLLAVELVCPARPEAVTAHHYWLEVDALTQPMQVREPKVEHGHDA